MGAGGFLGFFKAVPRVSFFWFSHHSTERVGLVFQARDTMLAKQTAYVLLRA